MAVQYAFSFSDKNGNELRDEDFGEEHGAGKQIVDR
jgi:hypothetical protein